MAEIEIQNDSDYDVVPERLEAAAKATLQAQAAPEGCALTIALTPDEMVQGLNQQFRGIDAPTDILSFPSGIQPPGYLGDLVIAFPYASAQAAREGHALMDSLALLVVHGTLHLLGYDHDTPEKRAAMWAAQETVLHMLGISPDIVPALEGDTEHDDHDQAQ
ncbi:MAG: rRNA maturation RNase YbeY [Anaerolineae bacterium]